MNKKIFTIGIISIFMLTSIFSLSGLGLKTNSLKNSEGTLYVDDDYDTSTPGWGVTHFAKIQDAIDAAEEDSRIKVMSGTYSEIIVNKSGLTISGEDRETTEINNRKDVVVSIKDYDVTITGFTIRIVGLGGFAIYTGDVENTVISNNKIILENEPTAAISLNCNSIVSDNIIISEGSDRPYWAIYPDGGNNSFINNYISGFQTGIFQWYNGGNNIIENNTFTNNNFCIDLVASADNLISRNNFFGNNFGIFIHDGNSYGNVIYHNNFKNNKEYNARESIACSGNKWDNNYWDDWIGLRNPSLSFLPKIIRGFKFDWNPASEPFDLGLELS